MSRIRNRLPSPATGIALAALLVALGGVAVAAIPDSAGTIHACYQKGSGNLRVVESATDCRNSEQALDWNKEGRPGEVAGLTVLPSTTVAQGERRLLLQAGTLTFTAYCQPRGVVPGDDVLRPVVEVTTSQDHAALTVDFGRFTSRDLLTGQTARIPGTATSNTTDVGITDADFTAISPDRTIVTGILSLSVNAINDPGRCLFGGHVATSQ